MGGLDLRTTALVGPTHHQDSVELFLTPGGKGDSIYSQRNELGSVFVPAERLSSQLPDLQNFDAVFLRMNIEGSELAVLEDLHSAGLLSSVSGFYGMWDDLSKIEPSKDKELLRRMGEWRVDTCTFNDRDFEHPFRRIPDRRPMVLWVRLALIRRRMWWQIARSSSS